MFVRNSPPTPTASFECSIWFDGLEIEGSSNQQYLLIFKDETETMIRPLLLLLHFSWPILADNTFFSLKHHQAHHIMLNDACW
jgi:hypothetical protein